MSSERFLKYLNSLAHEDVEVDVTHDGEKKKIKKPFAPYNDLRRELSALAKPTYLTVERQLSNLVTYTLAVTPFDGRKVLALLVGH